MRELSPEPDPGLVDLCSEHARSLIPPIGWRIVWLAAAERVAEGRTGPEIACGKPFFELMSQRPEEAARFNRMMIATSGDEPAAVAGAYDFSEVERLVDVGGGIGTVLLEILHRHPHLRGVLVDLPGVTGQARENIDSAGLSARCEVVEGDFLEFDLPDRFGLVFVAFNTFFGMLSQEAQVRCFRNVARHLVPGGRFLVEAFVTDMAWWRNDQAVEVLEVEVDRVVLEASRHDPVAQLIDGAYIDLSDGKACTYPVRMRYIWPSELDLMRRAADISREGHAAAARLAWPGAFEYELQAALEYTFRRRGARGPAYTTIVGGGANATVLHYVRNDQKLGRNEPCWCGSGKKFKL